MMNIILGIMEFLAGCLALAAVWVYFAKEWRKNSTAANALVAISFPIAGIWLLIRAFGHALAANGWWQFDWAFRPLHIAFAVVVLPCLIAIVVLHYKNKRK